MPHRPKPKHAQKSFAPPPGLHVERELCFAELEARVSVLERIYVLVDWLAIEELALSKQTSASVSAKEPIVSIVPATTERMSATSGACEFFDLSTCDATDLTEGMSDACYIDDLGGVLNERISEAGGKAEKKNGNSADMKIAMCESHLRDNSEIFAKIEQMEVEMNRLIVSLELVGSSPLPEDEDGMTCDCSSGHEVCEKCAGDHETSKCPFYPLPRDIVDLEEIAAALKRIRLDEIASFERDV
mmetsp:Transcript_84500/g.132015  ORF Transcript_84500/g.132015 Transcript_84500/m.132015 type:complete len:244 (+) Transcript_84500:166-897(+)